MHRLIVFFMAEMLRDSYFLFVLASASSSIVVNNSRSRTRLSHFSRGIWEIHAEYTCFLRLQLLAKIGYITQCKGKNPRGLYEIAFPLERSSRQCIASFRHHGERMFMVFVT